MTGFWKVCFPASIACGKGSKGFAGLFRGGRNSFEESLNQLVDAMAVVCSVYTMFFKKAILQGRRNIGSFSAAAL